MMNGMYWVSLVMQADHMFIVMVKIMVQNNTKAFPNRHAIGVKIKGPTTIPAMAAEIWPRVRGEIPVDSSRYASTHTV